MVFFSNLVTLVYFILNQKFNISSLTGFKDCKSYITYLEEIEQEKLKAKEARVSKKKFKRTVKRKYKEDLHEYKIFVNKFRVLYNVVENFHYFQNLFNNNENDPVYIWSKCSIKSQKRFCNLLDKISNLEENEKNIIESKIVQKCTLLNEDLFCESSDSDEESSSTKPSPNKRIRIEENFEKEMV